MLFLLIVLAFLCEIANGADEDIKVCSISVPVPGQNNAVVRPSVPVEYCQDRDAAACFEIFKPMGNDVLANNRMPNENYKVLDKCQQEPYIMLARQMCPWMCATCCMTKEYNCENATTLPSPTATCRDERQNCAAFRATNNCGGVFRTTMIQQCARTCGYCA
ncbi:unnamed protein product [Dracunculus medinensis]|uniref:ShKT domain-containing protein n=1 Tax=Dracunculus medinensis TaxID=318479 RepID=A0A0N4URH7_DRAME|nr:unnamed protein product [Dracunculus medinensis]